MDIVERELQDLAQVFREKSKTEAPLTYTEYLSLSRRIRHLALKSMAKVNAEEVSLQTPQDTFKAFSNAAKEALKILEEIKKHPQLLFKKRKTSAPSFVCPSFSVDEEVDARKAPKPQTFRPPASKAKSLSPAPNPKPWWYTIWNIYDNIYATKKRPKTAISTTPPKSTPEFSVPSMRPFLIENRDQHVSLEAKTDSFSTTTMQEQQAADSSSKAIIEKTPKVTFILPDDKTENPPPSAPFSFTFSTPSTNSILTSASQNSTLFEPSSFNKNISTIEIKEIEETKDEKKDSEEHTSKSVATTVPSIAFPSSSSSAITGPSLQTSSSITSGPSFNFSATSSTTPSLFSFSTVPKDASGTDSASSASDNNKASLFSKSEAPAQSLLSSTSSNSNLFTSTPSPSAFIGSKSEQQKPTEGPQTSTFNFSISNTSGLSSMPSTGANNATPFSFGGNSGLSFGNVSSGTNTSMVPFSYPAASQSTSAVSPTPAATSQSPFAGSSFGATSSATPPLFVFGSNASKGTDDSTGASSPSTAPQGRFIVPAHKLKRRR